MSHKNIPRKQPFAVFDIDGTIFRSSLVIELMEAGIKKGLFPAKAVHDYQTEQQAWKKRKDRHAYINYIEALTNSYGKHLKGISHGKLEILAETVVSEQFDHTYTYPRQLIKELKSQGYFLIAISGSPRELVSRFTKMYGFDTYAATEYQMVEDTYTGECIPTNVGKDAILRRMVTQHGLDYAGSIAIGDTKGDISMLENVEQAIAFNPDMYLFEVAESNGWHIVIERKNMVYQLEHDGTGYRLKTEP